MIYGALSDDLRSERCDLCLIRYPTAVEARRHYQHDEQPWRASFDMVSITTECMARRARRARPRGDRRGTSCVRRRRSLTTSAIDALALCDVDGRMFLEMDEEDLAESDELGLDMKGIHAVLKLQNDLEALELSHHGERPPLPGSSVLPVYPAAAASARVAADAERKPSPSESAGQGSALSSGGSGSSSFWSLPSVSVDAEGNSFFCEKKVALGAGSGSGIGALSQLIPAAGIKFRETPGDYDFDFHCAPARQFVVSLDAEVDIEVTDGTRKIFTAGTVMLAEDTWGKGHRSRAVDGKSRKSLFIVIPDDFVLES